MNRDHPDALATSLRTLVSLDRNALAKRWIAVFKSPVPRNAHVVLLQGALAWHDQIGDKAACHVTKLIQRLRRQAISPVSNTVLTPGTRLLREWRGETHHVTVLSDGFEYKGNSYRSLTAVSRQITGTAWSGPLFFGLRS